MSNLPLTGGLMLPELCEAHRLALVTNLGLGPHDPWVAYEIAVRMVMFQGTSCDPRAHEETQGQAWRLGMLGCLACRDRAMFQQVIEEGTIKGIRGIKELGEQWVLAAGGKKEHGHG